MSAPPRPVAPAAPVGAVTVRVPASSANLGPGFDAVGLALDVWDEVEAEVTGDEVRVDCHGEGAGQVPADADNLVVQAMTAAWRRHGLDAPAGLRVVCRNRVPHSRGLGSSASAAVAGAAAALALSGVDLGTRAGLDLVADVAGDLEGHPDNSSASVYGSMTVSWRDGERWPTAVVAVDPRVRVVAAVPAQTLATSRARAALPASVPHAEAARNGGRAALLVHAMSAAPELLLAATADRLHQEQRRTVYPATMALVDRLRAEGLGACVSGAGPTVLVLTTADGSARALDLLDSLEGWDGRPLDIPRIGVHRVSRT